MGTLLYRFILVACFFLMTFCGISQSKQYKEYSQIDSLIELSENLIVTKPKESKLKAIKALELSESRHDKKRLAWAVETYATAAYYLGEKVEAKKNYIKALLLYNDLNDKGGISSILHNLALLEQDNGRYHNALKLYRQALANDESSSDYQGILTTRNALATLYLDMEQFAKAAIMLDSLRILSNLYHSPTGRLDYHINRGVYFSKTGALNLAQSQFLKASALADSLKHYEDKILVKLNLAEIAYRRKNYSKSLQLCNEVLKNGGVTNIQEISAMALLQKGLTLAALDSIPKARQLLARARSLTLVSENYRQMGPLMLQIGDAQYDFKNINEAIGSYKESVFYARKAGMVKTLADVYRALFKAYKELGKEDSSKIYLNRFSAVLDSLERYNNKGKHIDTSMIEYVEHAKEFASNAGKTNSQSYSAYNRFYLFLGILISISIVAMIIYRCRTCRRKE